jgi:hypothetical protein
VSSDKRPLELAAELAALGPVMLGAAVSLLPLEMLAAVQVGLDVGYLRAGAPLDDDYPGGRWHRNHVLPEYTELQKRRYPPTGDRAAWVRSGPPGHVNFGPSSPQEEAA